MAFIFHVPRKRTYSSDPRISISKTFISLNPSCINTYFKNKRYAMLGHDPGNCKILIVPVEDKKKGLAIIHNKNWTQKYINAKKFLSELPFEGDCKGEYRCKWDEANKGIVIDIKSDKIK